MKKRRIYFVAISMVILHSLTACTNIYESKTSDLIESNSSKQSLTARERWDSLIAENFKSRPILQQDPGLSYWDYVDGLPNVFIYGDSISIGYTATVRSELQGVANVIRLPSNGSHSGEIISKMQNMHSSMSDPRLSDPWDLTWDVIHFNAGLHDLKYVVGGVMDKENGEQVNSIEQYAENLRNAIAHFQQIAPDAELVFATTTPVPEGDPGRYVEDVAIYNDVALSVMAEYGIAVNDLYTFTLPHFDDWVVAEGNVHYNEIGTTAQGAEVARIIRPRLEALSAAMRSSK